MTVGVVEDQALISDLLRQVASRLGHLVIAIFADGRKALEFLRRNDVDLAIVDICLEGLSGLDLITELREGPHSPRIFVVSGYCSDRVVYRVERAEVDGFLCKRTAKLSDYKAAFQEIAAHRRFFCQTFRAAQEARRSDPDAFEKLLTREEQDILDWLADGCSRQEIAAHFGISERTVNWHCLNMEHHLGLQGQGPEGLKRFGRHRGFSRAIVSPMT